MHLMNFQVLILLLVSSWFFCEADQLCQLPLDPGNCVALIEVYGFNSTTKKCQLWSYGGCGGNENRFNSSKECEDRCSKNGTLPLSKNETAAESKNDTQEAAIDICKLPMEKGPCKAYHEKYGYNSGNEQCEKFVYGGCNGTKNRFDTMEGCRDECKRGDTVNDKVEDMDYHIEGEVTEASCYLPLDGGPCRGYFERFGFNTTSERCEKFIFGGCEGNTNNFETTEDCDTQCKGISICGYPIERGMCRASLERFAFNSTTGECQKFMYGGCGGTKNRFSTKLECQDTCIPKKSVRAFRASGTDKIFSNALVTVLFGFFTSLVCV